MVGALAPLGGRGRRRRRGRHAAGVRCGRGPRGAPPRGDDGAEDDQDGEQEIADGPQPCLREPPGISEPEPRLDQRGVAQQREHAAEIAGGVEEVRIAGGGVPGLGEPPLQERRGRAHHEERQAHREREQERARRARGWPRRPGQPARVDAEGQHGERHGEQRQVQDRLPADAEPRRAWRGRRRSRRGARPGRTPCRCSRRRACRRGAAGSSCPPSAAPRTGAWRRRTAWPRRAAGRASGRDPPAADCSCAGLLLLRRVRRRSTEFHDRIDHGMIPLERPLPT